ncbi:hypothetical protein HK096_009917 [Nowakowskiella sp. JEL0078]|nr:hypothetical protein HK096_009917 [Nowakowskiella sp. JEL0078]
MIRKLQVYVFPTLHNKHVFHAKFLKPKKEWERHAIVAGYIFRKWRFMASDYWAYYWHGFGVWATNAREISPSKPSILGRFFGGLYAAGNRISTRRSADEYFLKTVPSATQYVEFILAPGVEVERVQDQLKKWIDSSDRHQSKLFMWSLIFPACFQVAKFHLAPANILFAYVCFRVNAHYRAMQGARTLQYLIDNNQISWNEDTEFRKSFLEIVKEVETEEKEWMLNKMKNLKLTDSNQRHFEEVAWKFIPGLDLHDEVLMKLEERLKIAELSRTYRRARLQYFVHDGREA